MKRILKKNRVIVTVLAVMIAVAGYLNYSGNLLKKQTEKLQPAEDQVLLTAEEEGAAGDIYTETIQPVDGSAAEDAAADDSDPEITDVPGEAVLTAGTAGDAVIAQAKLNREQLRAKNKEVLMEMLNNENLTEEQKSQAAANVSAMTDIAEREAAAELLLEAKGYTDSVVSITDDMADVVVNREELDEAQCAQIEDIVKRKTDISGEHIIITPRSQQG